MAKPSDLAQIGRLYFIESGDQDAMKIGFATDTYVRLKNLQSGNPGELSLVTHVPCTYGAEMRLHKLLRGHQIRLEWYPINNLTLAIQDEIEDVVLGRAMCWLADQPQPVSRPESSFQEAADFLDGIEDMFPLTVADMDRIIPPLIEEFAEEYEDA